MIRISLVLLSGNRNRFTPFCNFPLCDGYGKRVDGLMLYFVNIIKYGEDIMLKFNALQSAKVSEIKITKGQNEPYKIVTLP